MNRVYQKGGKPVTIIVGIICKDGIVISCDSQASSMKGVPLKRSEYTKIYEIPLSVKGYAVLSGAGTGAFITRASEILSDKCRNNVFRAPREFADICEDVVTEIFKRYVIDRGKALGMTKAGMAREVNRNTQWQDDSIESPGIWILTGIYCNEKKPEWCLYTVHPDSIAEKAEKYDAIGSGSAVAEYLLARLWSGRLEVTQAVKIAVYIIEQVKKFDPFCGGPTQVVSLSKDGILRLSPKEVKEVSDQVMEWDDRISNVWQTVVFDTKGESAAKAKAKD